MTAAASQLDAAYGHGWIRVVRNNEPMVFLAFRYSDTSPWNGGDFIYHESSTLAANCSSGIPVHNTTTGTLYMLTASHCFWAFGGIGTSVHNGYVENDFTIYPGSSKTKIGSVTANDIVKAGTTSLDTALIQTSTSVDNFDAAWDSQGTAIQVGEAANHVGDSVCTSGAFEGQICDSLVITSLDNTFCGNEGWGTFCVDHLAEANSGSTEHVAIGKGDSGGPVYSYSGSNLLARGMMDAGTDPVSCTSVPTGTSGRECFANVFFVEMAHINSNWGIVPNS